MIVLTVLFPQVRAEVLRLLFADEGGELHLRDLTRWARFRGNSKSSRGLIIRGRVARDCPGVARRHASAPLARAEVTGWSRADLPIFLPMFSALGNAVDQGIERGKSRKIAAIVADLGTRTRGGAIGFLITCPEPGGTTSARVWRSRRGFTQYQRNQPSRDRLSSCSADPSPRISASFLARDHRLSWASRATADGNGNGPSTYTSTAPG